MTEEREPRRWTYALIVETLLFGWIFIKGLFARPEVVKTPSVTDQGAGEIHAARVAVPEQTGRAADRNVNSESRAAKLAKWGTLLVICAFAIALAGGAGFLILYWSGSGNQALGGTLALCLGGFGLALVLYAHWLMRHKEAIEQREILPSSPRELHAAFEAYDDGAQEVRRRGLLIWLSAAMTALFAAISVSLMRSLATPSDESLYSVVWKRGQRLVTAAGTPVSIHSLQPGSSIVVFPEHSHGIEKTQTVLIRVEEQFLQLPKERANWAPLGYVAYSRVCTHAGCTVGLFESKTNLLLCPCHQSTFDILRGARPTGGPAARSLPQLPLYADGDGNLRAAGGFTAPPGPGFTGMPS